ncbi:MAG: sigma-70 family RNA polymerase sigma factor, partial [Actinomycetota bacterium]
KDRIRTEGSFKGYLFGIARRQLFRHLRDQHRDPELDFMSRSIADLGPGLPTNLGRKREHRVMIEALRNLPLDLQLVLELYYWEELPAPAVAEALEIPEGTVRSRVRRAREALASAWGELQKTQLPPTEADLELRMTPEVRAVQRAQSSVVCVDLLQPERATSHGPLFQVMFNFHNEKLDLAPLPGLTLTPFTPEQSTAKFDLTLTMDARGGATLEYSTDLWDPPFIHQLAAHFRNLAEELSAH